LAKFRKNKFFKKSNKTTKTEDFENSETEKQETVLIEETSLSYKNSSVKSWIKSGTKYVYIIVAAALLSGIFTPFTIGFEFNIVISGIFIVLLGLAGGVLVFQGTKRQKSPTIMVLGGFALMIISLILIFQIAGYPLI